ncbi:MAG TPA: peptidylprolyl isomerase [Paludibacteraceae bacterium]|mgnify:CR=1 FL=1|nr:peptidylprolyl isomerase [Paludibacteraceae bacterium]HQF50128.1 peptidylprolyl isomerase [Paludibacteraceae bacterium]HQJ89079.1 peptidylprolyl isomerase [Paludibacteraceae bacterium]
MKLKLAFLVGALISTVSVSSQESDPVIMTIGGEPIHKSEFEYIYHKNNTNTSLEKKSLDEYVNLFVNFKMKVFEAKENAMDDKASFLKEYKSYEDQLVAPYLIDKAVEDSLIKEAYDRMQEEITASHILVKIEGEDTLKAYQKINAIYSKLKGGVDFATLARDSSDCPSSRTGGSLGIVTPFSTVYPFENMAYKTSVGKFSKPFRTEFGYHIVYVTNRKKATIPVRVSHIYKRMSDSAKSQIDSLYLLLKNGAKFEDLVEKNSDDRESAYKGGDLGWITTGRYPVQIENMVRQLENEGDISPVVETPFGYHILFLKEKKNLGTYEENYENIKKKVERDSRSSIVSHKTLERLALKYDFTVVDGGLDVFYKLAEDSLPFQKLTDICKNLYAPLYIMNGEYFPQNVFSDYFKEQKYAYDSERKSLRNNDNNKRTRENNKYAHLSPVDFVNAVFYEYYNKELIELEKKDLIAKNSDLRNLLREYSDGLLLFDISNTKVWSKASSDDKGLSRFFDENKANYKWDAPRFKGKIVYCSDSSIMVSAKKMMNTVPADSFDAKVKQQFDKKVRIENGTYPKGVNKAVDKEIFKDKTAEVKDKYAFCIGKLINAPESYKDVKGPVTADYQNYLEDEWVARLRKKYNVVIKQDVLKTVKE